MTFALGKRHPDVLVVGAGVFGLWCARACLAEGLTVEIDEATRPGAGASGSPVGALAPADPARWTELSALQLEGLLRLPGEIGALEAETGLSCGYLRRGRVQPLTDPRNRAGAAARVEAAGLRWKGRGELRWLADIPDWLSADCAPHGVLVDDLTAQIDPPAYLTALCTAIERRATLHRGRRLSALAPGHAHLGPGRRAAGHIVLATGWESLGLLGYPPKGSKGQAALLRCDLSWPLPVLSSRGLFVVSHGPGRVGVGSTHEHDWSHSGPDAALDGVLERAGRLLPALRGAEVVLRWAGIRPRAPGRGPMIGPVPGRQGISIATGAGGIGLALAHLAGRSIAASIMGKPQPVTLPASCDPACHLGQR